MYKVQEFFLHPIAHWLRPGIFFFHQGRSGSTVLSRLVGQHPKFKSQGEIFNRYWADKKLPDTAEKILRRARLDPFPRYALVEAKFFECQHLALLGLSLPAFVQLVRQCGYRRYIVLNRRNYLKKLVSTQMGIDRGQKWHVGNSEQVVEAKVTIDVNRVVIQGKTAPIMEMFSYMDEQFEKLNRILAGDSVLNLTYENDILPEPTIAYKKICAWLGIKALPVKVGLQRTNPRPLEDVIENWNEVVTTLSGTPYAWMLDDQDG